MRLVTYQSKMGWCSGIAVGDMVVDSAAAARAASIRVGRGPLTNRTILRWTEAEKRRLEAVATELTESAAARKSALAAEDLRLGPPIPDPEKFICVGLNYRAHAREPEGSLPRVPTLFAKYRNTLTGSRDPIILPRISKEVDCEGALAVVIGHQGKDISRDRALDYVGGYMALNDVSARDIQMRTSQWLSGKTPDTFAPCGPALMVNEIRDPQALDISTRLNGETVHERNTGDMIFSIRELIAYASQLMTLEPGDLISTGTSEHVGFGRTPPMFLKPGDFVEVEIQSIGVLRNPVVGRA